MQQHIAIFTVVVGLLAAAAFLTFGDDRAAEGTLLVIAGSVAAVKSKSMAKAQNRIIERIGRYYWNPWGSFSPRLFCFWGIGIAIIGFAMILEQ